VRKKEFLAKSTLLLTALIWGAGFIFSQTALDAGIGPSALLMAKFGIAAVLCGVLFRKAIRTNMSRRALRRCVPIGVILVVSFYAQTFGLKYSTPSNCALITAAYVVITPFLWRLCFKRPVRRLVYFASALCFAGVVTLSVDFAGGVSFRMGDIWTLAAALLFAVQLVATEAFVGEMDYKTFLFIETATAAICSLAVFLITERDLSGIRTPIGLGSVVYLGCLSTFLCSVMQTSAQRYVTSGPVALILSMEAMFGAGLSVLLGYDPPSWKIFVGGAAILLSVVLPEVFRERAAAGESGAAECKTSEKT
jgi:drug/metabolite transporter (DMT)-like permease